MFVRQEMQEGSLVGVPSELPCPIEFRVEVRGRRASLPVAIGYEVSERVDPRGNDVRVGASVVFDVKIRNRREPAAFEIFQIMRERVLGMTQAVLLPVPARVKEQARPAPFPVTKIKKILQGGNTSLGDVGVLRKIKLGVEQPALGNEIELVRSLPSVHILRPPVVAIAAGAVA